MPITYEHRTNGRIVVPFSTQGGLVYFSPYRVQGLDFSTGQEFKQDIETFNSNYARSDLGATITSTDEVSNEEGQQLAHELTGNKYNLSWEINGGADAAQFDLDDNILTWVADGTQAFDTPLDDDEDNVYEVTVEATDSSDNVTSQTISVTVTEAV